MMTLYDYLAPFYDPVFHHIYAPFRRQALERLNLRPGDTVLDLACGTGQNFPFIASRISGSVETDGKEDRSGTIIGADISGGMLRRAARYALNQQYCSIRLLQINAAERSSMQELVPLVDAVVCTHGFSSMPDWEVAFKHSYAMLKPGGTYLIHDIHAPRRNPHSALVELVTRTNLSIPYWIPLQSAAVDVTLSFIPNTWPIFGGSLFTAVGKKRK